MNKEKARLICNALDDKKANRITVIDIEGISIVADGFIIADGDNRNQVQAMADNVQDEMLKAGYHCKSVTSLQPVRLSTITAASSSAKSCFFIFIAFLIETKKLFFFVRLCQRADTS